MREEELLTDISEQEETIPEAEMTEEQPREPDEPIVSEDEAK